MLAASASSGDPAHLSRPPAPPGTAAFTHPEHADQPFDARATAAAGARAGLVAGATMLVTLMAISEIANDPTSRPGTDSSTWTPVTSLLTLVLSDDTMAGSFQVLPILGGIAWHAVFSVLFGVAGAALLVWMLGTEPHPLAAALVGFAYALGLQILVLNLATNAIQDPNTIYESLPSWGWWAAHSAYGITLGLLLSRARGR